MEFLFYVFKSILKLIFILGCILFLLYASRVEKESSSLKKDDDSNNKDKNKK